MGLTRISFCAEPFHLPDDGKRGGDEALVCCHYLVMQHVV